MFNQVQPTDIWIAVLLIAGVVFSLWKRKLTPAAAFTGAATGAVLYLGGGLTGILLMTGFFILGTAASSWKKEQKRSSRASDAHQTTRNAGQVLANAGVAAAIALIAWCFPGYRHLAGIMIAGCFASATADTLSSELGMVYGRRFYHILHFKQEEKGLDGLISLEGTLLGTAGAAIIATVYALLNRFDAAWLLIVLAGTLGNLADSVLGATLERKLVIGNDMVNTLNTLTGALTAGIGWYLISGNV
ncbi:DUF92 domain-containing protein [Deminuibacter soli]|uniref:DUF92 domain-containing protein n=1 Tax=Deminuibacter soli TaxID=2291815 RepID=A0A3E1NHK6_9BACT|nr:DUF92 domain-containing protein [Deminuibacter soli]RFM27436.1 DUF92 domain-containing protein [Deminuibacter soli]